MRAQRMAHVDSPATVPDEAPIDETEVLRHLEEYDQYEDAARGIRNGVLLGAFLWILIGCLVLAFVR